LGDVVGRARGTDLKGFKPMDPPRRPNIAELAIAAEPEAWRALGFAVGDDGAVALGSVTVRLAGAGAGKGITGWALEPPVGEIDGLPVVEPAPSGSVAQPVPHPNSAVALDHVVVITPDWDRTVAALAAVGVALSREREVPSPDGVVRQGFVRLGQPILELVERASAEGPARFWGLVAIVADLDAAAEIAGDLLGAPRGAVQPGRRIATVRAEAGAGVALALMTPEGE
jgi:hypothetical protein